jgi:V8-like Glu-specific endopeptidase
MSALLMLLFLSSALAQPAQPDAVTPSGGARAPAQGAAASESARGASVIAYWTAERMRDAQPMPMPLPSRGSRVPTAGSDSLRGAAAAAVGPTAGSTGGGNARAPTGGYSGAAPTVSLPTNGTLLFTPRVSNGSAAAGALGRDGLGEDDNDVEAAARAAIASVLYYTSSQIVPLAGDTAYPYSAVGKLFFSAPAASGTPAGNYQCSASVVGQRVILTAGHCVHSGRNGQAGFYTNFRFVPALRDGFAPFGTWTAVGLAVSGAWFFGGGSVPNPADYAAIALNTNGGLTVAARVGRLGLALGVLAPNQITQLGYPCNINACARMHRVDSGASSPGGANCFEYGSDMSSGASGGPWVQNFGVAGSGQPAATSAGRTLANAVVGVASYGPPRASAGRFLGASVLDARVTNVINAACGTLPNCT